jgi:hypothetical protein
LAHIVLFNIIVLPKWLEESFWDETNYVVNMNMNVLHERQDGVHVF